MAPFFVLDANNFMKRFDSWFDSLSSQQKFDTWVHVESLDMSWINDLPKCPPCLVGGKGNFRSPDSKIWESPKSVTNPEKFHPGAVWEVRTLHATSKGAGNQCTYDEDGKLITTKYGCGTADRRQATRSVPAILKHWWNATGHIGEDVAPFNLAYELDGNKLGKNVDKYIDVRPFVGP